MFNTQVSNSSWIQWQKKRRGKSEIGKEKKKKQKKGKERKGKERKGKEERKEIKKGEDLATNLEERSAMRDSSSGSNIDSLLLPIFDFSLLVLPSKGA